MALANSTFVQLLVTSVPASDPVNHRSTIAEVASGVTTGTSTLVSRYIINSGSYRASFE